jgi:hypothetical protein
MDNSDVTTDFAAPTGVDLDNPNVGTDPTDGQTPTDEGDNQGYGQFNSADDLYKSYQELERKLGENSQYVNLGREVDRIGIDRVNSFLENQDAFQQWQREQASASSPVGPENTKDWWEKAVADPKNAFMELMGNEFQSMIRSAMNENLAYVNQQNQQTQSELEMMAMRSVPGFAENEQKFMDWTRNTKPDMKTMYEIWQLQELGRTARESALKNKRANRMLASNSGGSLGEPTEQLNLKPATNFQEALQNAKARIAAGERLDV